MPDNLHKIEIFNKIWDNNKKIRELEAEIKRLSKENSKYRNEIDDYYGQTKFKNDKNN